MMAGGRISTSALGRTASMGLAATRIGLKQLENMGRRGGEVGLSPREKQQARLKHEREIGKILFQSLNQLKGTALKASQILSMEVDFLPKGVREELARGCYRATPLNSALVYKAFRREFAKQPEDLFSYFDPKAFSAASLGQVHFARLEDGRKLAVKIQYPGIAASIRSDVKLIGNMLALLSNASDLIPGRRVTRIVMDEIELQLNREVDYEQEAENIAWFRDNLDSPDICLPQVLPELSSNRILVMEYLCGDHIDEWLEGEPPQSERDRYGQMLFDLFLHSVFELGCVHADPHPGNFLFMGDGRLGLIDFGCIKKMPPLFARGMADFYNLLIDNQASPQLSKLLKAYQAMDLVADDLDFAEFGERLQPNLDPVQKWVIEPFLTPVFDFSKKAPMPQMDTDAAGETMPYLKGMPRDILYFDRTYHGLVHMLKRLGARVKTENPWIGPQHVRGQGRE